MVQKAGGNERATTMNQDVERTRERLAEAVRDTRYALDIPRRLQHSFRRQPAVWIAGAVLLGAVVMLMPRRKTETIYVTDGKKVRPKSKLLETGFLLGAARIAASLLKPLVLNFVRERMASGEPFRFGRGGRT